jgi:WD40 repeat protein
VKLEVTASPVPFKGLAPFGDTDLEVLFFFGRARETEVIAANLQAARLTVLYGPSGVGKSSVLRAGVTHRLRKELDAAVEIVDRWAGDAVESVRAAVAAKPEDGDLYLILDQFEEYFLYHADEDDVPRLLADIVAERGLRVNILIGIRDDSLARLDTFRRPIPNLLANRLQLDRLDRDAAREAIVGPIERYNALTGERVAAEPELVEAVLDEVTAGRVDLGRAGRGSVEDRQGSDRVEAPYLQLVLERLWEAEREAGSDRLRVETLRRLGGAARIVQNHLEHAMAGLTPAEKEAAAAMYNHLVTPSGTKIAHGARDLAGYASVPENEAANVLAKLVQERIVRASSHNGPAATRYEIFHDVLADAVLAWRARHEEQRALQVAEERRRRAHRVAAAAIAGLIVVAAIAVFALLERGTARSQADRARARELAAKAVGALGSDPAASVRFAYDAARLERGLQEEDVLRKSLTADRLRQTVDADGPVTVVDFDRSGKHVLAGSTDGKIYISSGPVLDQGAPVSSAAFAPSGDGVVSGSDDGLVHVWNAATGASLARLSAGGPVRSLLYARRGRLLVAASSNGWIRVWRSPGWRLVRSFRATKDEVVRAAVDARGDRIAVVTHDPYVRVFTGQGRLVRKLTGDGFAGDAAFSPGGRRLATSDYLGHVTIWRSRDASRVRALLGGQRDIPDLEWSPDGTKLAAGSADATARLWEVATGLQMATMVHSEEVSRVAFSPDGEYLVTASGQTARVWGATPDKAGRPISVLAGHTAPIAALAFGPDGRTVATGSLDRTARLWDPGSELELQPIVRQGSAFTALAATPAGDRLVTGDGAGLVRQWTLRGRAIGPPKSYLAPISDVALTARGQVDQESKQSGAAVAISPDGSHIASAYRNRLAIKERGSRTTIRRLDGGPIHDLAISRDGATLAVALDDGTAEVWNIDPLRRLHVLRGHQYAVLAVSFSHDGRYVATGSEDSDARVWDARTGRAVHLLRGHFGPVRAVSFSRNDRWVLTAGPTVAGVWDTKIEDHGFFRGPVDDQLTGAVWAGRDGRTIVTSSRNGTLRAFRCYLCGDMDELLALAKERLSEHR